MLAAAAFASHHVGARVAFDDGASVAMAVLARSAGTALALYFLLRLLGVPLGIPRPLLGTALGTGVLLAFQSYCLYSAVARIPVALALVVFHTAPMLFVLYSWVTGKEAPRVSALVAMLLALAGLALALDLPGAGFAARWAEYGTGVMWSLAGAVGFAIILYSNANWLKGMDGRVRTFVMTGVTAVVVLTAGAAADALAVPSHLQGWIGIAVLTVLYCAAMCAVFIALPRIPASSTVALNFEPVVLLGLAWVVLGQAMSAMQIVGVLLVAGAIATLGLAKRP
jgi:drug/metabolite transporter (DMT)-like permease